MVGLEIGGVERQFDANMRERSRRYMAWETGSERLRATPQHAFAETERFAHVGHSLHALSDSQVGLVD